MPGSHMWSSLGSSVNILYEFVISVVRATAPTHLLLLKLIIPVIFRDGYK
jgi:hypothetical protein